MLWLLHGNLGSPADWKPVMEVLRAGGLGNGGWNFDAKVRRQSIDAVDLLYGHIGGIDTIARALLRAAAIIEDGQLEAFRQERYAGWQGELGKAIHADGATLASVAEHAIQSNRGPEPKSGRQEWCQPWATGTEMVSIRSVSTARRRVRGLFATCTSLVRLMRPSPMDLRGQFRSPVIG